MMARKLLVGAAWSILARLLGRMVDVVTLLVLARLLTPADFGVVAVAMTLVSILEAVFELPTSTMLLCQTSLDRADFDTAFTLAALRGLALGAVGLLLAVPFAHIYGDGRLIPLIAVLSLAPIARGLASPRMVLLMKSLQFRGSFAVDVTGRIGGCLLATVVAVAWRDHWAIVASTVTAQAVTSLTTYAVAPYRPRLTLARWPAFRHFFGWSSAAQLVSAINWQCDRLLLGRLVPRAALGQFTMASDLAALPNQSVFAPLMTPTLAAFTQFSGDKARLREAYVRSTAAVLLVGLPMLVGLSLTAEQLIALVLGGKWSSAATLLQWLALEGIPYLFVMPAWPLAVASGCMHLVFRRNAVELAVKIPLLVSAALLAGIPGVVASRIIMTIIIAGVSMALTRQIIGLSVSERMLKHWRPVACVLAMGAAVLAVRTLLASTITTPVLLLLIEAGVGAATYAGLLLLLGVRPWHLLGRSPAVGMVAAE